ncbi:hypothetical protein Agub_g6090, partial [Astrephomene gubernaculifera]
MAAAGVLPAAGGGGGGLSTSASISSISPPGVRGGVAPPPPPAAPAARVHFAALDANQMLDLVVSLADLGVYPGDGWMAAHEQRMAALAGGG